MVVRKCRVRFLFVETLLQYLSVWGEHAMSLRQKLANVGKRFSMTIQTKQELKEYQEACDISVEILGQLKDAVRPGVLPIEIDRLADDLCKKHNVRPAFKGVGAKGNKYHHATCIAVNDTVVHGIPSKTEKFKSGDIVKVDFGLVYKGYITDHCFTVGISPISEGRLRFIRTAQKAIEHAALQAVVGNRVGNIGYAIQNITEAASYNVAKEFTGHGIGHTLHEPPSIPVFGRKNTGAVLENGMVLCVEAQILAGSDKVYFVDDGWTVKTVDGASAAMFEYMVVVRDNTPLFLTDTRGWGLTV